jgi:dUTP pyrophosphatase
LVVAQHLKKLPPGPQYVGVANGDVLHFEVRGYEPNEYTMEVQKLSSHACTPRRATEGSAGYDLFATDTLTIPPGQRALVGTGIAVKMPPGLYGRVAPRSGLAVKNGIQVGAGVIDADYRGEVKVLLFNQDADEFNIWPGYRIAQLILERHETPAIHVVTGLSGGQTERGAGGFGSTGTN